MNFNYFTRRGLAVMGWLAFAVYSRGATSAASFVAAHFPAPPPPSVLAVTDSLASALQEILGTPYPGGAKEIAFWRAQEKTVWILDTQGRTGIITAGIVIQRGRVDRVEVLFFRERRGEGVKAASFTRQFEGAALTDRGGLDRRIDGITGATISVRAVTNLARLALYLDRRVSDSDAAVEKSAP